LTAGKSPAAATLSNAAQPSRTHSCGARSSCKVRGRDNRRELCGRAGADHAAASGVDLSTERNTLVARYNAGGSIAESRSLVLREAVDDASFKAAAYNPSFVLMEYFGYLKREPEPEGYQFWLNVLKQ